MNTKTLCCNILGLVFLGLVWGREPTKEEEAIEANPSTDKGNVKKGYVNLALQADILAHGCGESLKTIETRILAEKRFGSLKGEDREIFDMIVAKVKELQSKYHEFSKALRDTESEFETIRDIYRGIVKLEVEIIGFIADLNVKIVLTRALLEDVEDYINEHGLHSTTLANAIGEEIVRRFA